MRLIWLGLLITACVFNAAAASCAPGSSSAVAAVPGEVLVIGRISSGAKKQVPKVEALNNYVVSRMIGLNMTGGRSVIERTVQDMAALMADGKVDYVTESLYGAMRLEAEGQGEIVLQEWKGKTPYFRSMFIAHRQAGIRMDALHGTRILFEDAGSTSGFFLPYVHLRSRGYRLVHESSPEAGGNDVITYSFAGSEITIAARVARRRVDLGAVSNTDWLDEKKTPLSLRPLIEVISETGAAPRRLVVVRRDLDPRVKQALIRILTTAADSPEGRNALEEYKAGGFGILTPKTSRQIAAARAVYKAYARELH